MGKLSQGLRQEIYNEIKTLSENPFLHPHIRKIKGTKFGYRLRFGRWRILFAFFLEEKQIEVVDIFLKKGKEDYSKRKNLSKRFNV